MTTPNIASCMRTLEVCAAAPVHKPLAIMPGVAREIIAEIESLREQVKNLTMKIDLQTQGDSWDGRNT